MRDSGRISSNEYVRQGRKRFLRSARVTCQPLRARRSFAHSTHFIFPLLHNSKAFRLFVWKLTLMVFQFMEQQLGAYLFRGAVIICKCSTGGTEEVGERGVRQRALRCFVRPPLRQREESKTNAGEKGEERNLIRRIRPTCVSI